MSDTAASIITKALHLFGIVDQTEQPTPSDMAACVPVLNDMLRSEYSDAAAQFLMSQIYVTLPQGAPFQIYSFNIGIADPSYLVQLDVVGVKAIWMNDITLTVNRETRMVPKADVVRTLQPGIVTKWHQERQADNSVKVYCWQPPRANAKALIEYGGRIPKLTNLTGTDVIAMPDEGIHDTTLLFGMTICQSYGRSLDSVGVIGQRAVQVDKRWRDYARGTQWLRFVRS